MKGATSAVSATSAAISGTPCSQRSKTPVASVLPGLALWAFAGLIVALAGAMASLDPEAVWERLEVRR